MKDIQIEIETEIDDDIRYQNATATRDGLVGHGGGYSSEIARERAISDLRRQEKALNPSTPNFENTPEAFLMRN